MQNKFVHAISFISSVLGPANATSEDVFWTTPENVLCILTNDDNHLMVKIDPRTAQTDAAKEKAYAVIGYAISNLITYERPR